MLRGLENYRCQCKACELDVEYYDDMFATFSNVDLALQDAFEQGRKLYELVIHYLRRRLSEALVERDKAVYQAILMDRRYN